MRRYLSIAAFPLLLLVAAHILSHARDGAFVLDGRFIGTDGYSHLVKAEELVDTGDWYANGIRRANTPFGESLHWPRAFDLVLIAGAALLRPFMDWPNALYAWGVVVSPVLHLMSFFVLLWAARRLFDDAGLVYLGMLFAAQLFITHLASIGRPDHHSLLLLLFVWLMGAGLRLVTAEAGLRTAVWAAVPAALGTWVSAVEFLVPIAAILAVLGLGWITVREDFAGKTVAFAIALVAGTGLAMLIEYGAAAARTVTYDTISLVHLSLLSLVALLALVVQGLDRQDALAGRPAARAGIAMLGAGLLVALMRLAFPKFFQGPLADVDPRVVSVWFQTISEFAPLLDLKDFARTLPHVVFHLGPVLLALPYLVHLCVKRRGRERRPWLVVLLLFAFLLPLALYQQRWAGFLQYVLVLPYAALLVALVCRMGRRRAVIAATGRAVAVLFFMLGFIFAGGLLSTGAPAGTAPIPCPLTDMADRLGQAYRERPRRILSHICFGPELLYRTPHEVVATPNHRNGAGILDTADALGGTPAEARIIIERRGVDLVLTCTGSSEGKLYRSDRLGRSLLELIEAEKPPAWLKPVTLPEGLARSFQLFEVRRQVAPPGLHRTTR